jgi:hypothetical protein
MENEFPSNSRKPPVEKRIPEVADKRVARVVVGEVVRRKKPFSKRMREMFTGDDEGSLTEYVVVDMIVPAIKDLLADVIIGSTERKLFGTTSGGRRARRPGGGPANRFAYDQVSRPVGRAEPRERISRTARARHDFDEIVIPTRPEAEEVLTQMFDLLDRYAEVSVAEFFELVGVSGNFADRRHGWTDLRGSRVSRAHGGGYVLDLPPTEVLEP